MPNDSNSMVSRRALLQWIGLMGAGTAVPLHELLAEANSHVVSPLVRNRAPLGRSAFSHLAARFDKADGLDAGATSNSSARSERSSG